MSTIYSLLQSIISDFTAFFSLKTKSGRIYSGILGVLLVAAGAYALQDETAPAATAETALPTVSVQSVNAFGGDSAVELIGTVAALSEARITSEVGGRVTAVPVAIGSTVRVGSVIARLENSTQYASLLQAEGAYEAALAAAEISNVSVAEANRGQMTANTTARNTLLSVKNTLDTVFYSQLADIYVDPNNTYRTPGFLGEDAPLIYSLRDHYNYFEQALAAWSGRINQASSADEYLQLIAALEADVKRMLSYGDTFRLLITKDNEKVDGFDATATAYLSTLGQVEGQLTSSLSSLASAEAGIEQAADTLERAQLGGTAQENSAANAQVKQALGGLRAAQAAYNKTIITAPIAGTIASLDLKVGEFVGSMTEIAKITNDTAYEITTFVTEAVASTLEVGTSVTLGNDIEGTVSTISSAISSGTARREIKIQSTDDRLVSGETVRIRIGASDELNTNEPVATSQAIIIPLTAIKFQGSNALVFTVNDNSELVAHEVTLGRTQGANVAIESGIDRDFEIVVDARGLSAGQRVSIQ